MKQGDKLRTRFFHFLNQIFVQVAHISLFWVGYAGYKFKIVSKVDLLRPILARISVNSPFWKYHTNRSVTLANGFLEASSFSSADFNADLYSSKGPSGFCSDSSVFSH